MPLVRADVTLPFFTGTPGDVVQNSFHFDADTYNSATAGLIGSRLTTFYTTAYGAGSERVSYIDWPLATVKVFNLLDPPPRVPDIVGLGMSTGTGTTLVPTEVACVLTFRAAAESGVAYQRLYNRVFLGGLSNAWMLSNAADSFPTLLAAKITSVKSAATALLAANTAGLEWVQVSKAGGVITARPIVGGWVDNSPDTQRRRSVLASSRNTW